MTAPTVLITGCNGQIGSELCRALAPGWEIAPMPRAALDLADRDSIASAIRSVAPDLIINAAGYTAVDRAEDEPDLAMRVNGEAPGVIGELARQMGTAVIHFSTDYVFDGRDRRHAYCPEDPPAPLSAYGRSKVAGERALAASGAAHLIIRTCWVYSMRGRNFLLAMLKQAASGRELRVVSDQTGTPTSAAVIAETTGHIAGRALDGRRGARGFSGLDGTYHVACSGSTTWCDFARAIFDDAGVSPLPPITPISAAQYASKAKRPLYSVLDCSSTEATFGVKLPPWRDALRDALAEISQKRGALTELLAGDAQ